VGATIGGATPLIPSYSGSNPNSYACTVAFAAANPTAAAFSITGTAHGYVDAVCGNLTIDNLGNRGFTAGGGTQDLCW
jgi:hypothetical protein